MTGLRLPSALGLPANSRVKAGRTWPAPPEARHTREFHIYRYDPDTAANPRFDSYTIDLDTCGPMVLDALIKIKNEIDPTLTFRRSCREGICGSCAMNMDGRNGLACTTRDRGPQGRGADHPLPHMDGDQGPRPRPHPPLRAICLIQPWLKTERRRRRKERRSRSPNGPSSTAYYECILCFCCSTSCPSYWWNADRFLGPAVLLQAYRWLADSRDEATGERLDAARGPVPPLSLPHDHELPRTCPKGLNPARRLR